MVVVLYSQLAFSTKYILILTVGVNFVLLNKFFHDTQLAKVTCCTQ